MQTAEAKINDVIPPDQRPGAFAEAIGGADGDAVIRAMGLRLANQTWAQVAADVGISESTIRMKVRAAKVVMRRRGWMRPEIETL